MCDRASWQAERRGRNSLATCGISASTWVPDHFSSQFFLHIGHLKVVIGILLPLPQPQPFSLTNMAVGRCNQIRSKPYTNLEPTSAFWWWCQLNIDRETEPVRLYCWLAELCHTVANPRSPTFIVPVLQCPKESVDQGCPVYNWGWLVCTIYTSQSCRACHSRQKRTYSFSRYASLFSPH